jgi:RHS repeat-associated protein
MTDTILLDVSGMDLLELITEINDNYIYDHTDWTDARLIKYAKKEVGVYYLRARYYDPATSRMLSEDLARDGLNWYTYCNNNPIMFIDSSGLVAKPIYDFINELIKAGEIKGYDYSWTAKGDKYTVTINGRTLTYDGSGKNKHDMSIWVEDGKLMAEDYDVAYFFRSTGWVQYFPGFIWNYEEQLFKVDTHEYFLSKPFSKDFANEVMSLRQTGFWGGLTATDIAAESYAHAVTLVYSSALKGLWDRAGSWYDSAKEIDIAANDWRKPRFDAIWTLVGKNTGNTSANKNIFRNNEQNK